MFEYFNKIEGENGRAGAAYRARVHSTTEKILSGDENMKDMAFNLLTLAQMAKPFNELDIPIYYAISALSDEYEEYLRKKYFHGLTPEEFEKDEKLMKEFNEIKAEIKYGSFSESYDNKPTREKVFKKKQLKLNSKQKRPYMAPKNQKDTAYLYIYIDMLACIDMLYDASDDIVFISTIIEKLEKEVSKEGSAILKLLKHMDKIYNKDGDLTLSECLDYLYCEDYMSITLDDYIKSFDEEDEEKDDKNVISFDAKNIEKEKTHEKLVYLKDLTKIDELSEEAKLWRNLIISKLRMVKKHQINNFVNDENLIIGIAKKEKDLILKSAAYELIYEDEDKYREKLSYIINR